MKPTNMNKWSENRYWQLKSYIKETSMSNKDFKKFYNRRNRHSNNIQLHLALNNPKLDILEPYPRPQEFYYLVRPYVKYGNHNLIQRPKVWLNYRFICGSPDPSWEEIRRLPQWIQQKVHKNIKWNRSHPLEDGYICTNNKLDPIT